jgi:hypothetical protein
VQGDQGDADAVLAATEGADAVFWVNPSILDEDPLAVAAVTGRPLRAERISDDAMRERLRGVGMADKQVEAILGMSTGLRDDFVPGQPRDVVSTTPTTLAAWAAQHLR